MRIGLVQDLDSGRPSLVRGGIRRLADGHRQPEVPAGDRLGGSAGSLPHWERQRFGQRDDQRGL